MSPLLEVDVDDFDWNAGSLEGVDVDDVDVGGLAFERMPERTLIELNNDNPASSPSVDADAVDVADHHEGDPNNSNKSGQATQEQQLREDTTAPGNTVLDSDLGALTQPRSDSVSLPTAAAKPALHENGAPSRRSGMRKTVSFASVVSTATMINSRGNKEKKEGAEKNLSPQSAEGAKAMVTGETASPTTEKPLLNDNSEGAPKHLLAPVAPGEGPSTEDTGSFDIATSNDTSRISFEGEQDGSILKNDENTSERSLKPDRPKRVPHSQMDPAERKAKQQAALKEAKLAAQNVRKLTKSKSTGNLKSHAEEGSVVSNTSSLTHDSPKAKGGFFKNPFKRKSKPFDASFPISKEAAQAGPPEQTFKQPGERLERASSARLANAGDRTQAIATRETAAEC